MTEVPTGNIAEELALATTTLDAARLLAGAGFHRDAVTRAYYAVFHAACALLASVGLKARTHEGVRSLVSEHFVRPGVLDADHARTLRRAAGDRNDADYDAASVFTAEDSREDITRAAAFIEAASKIVAAPKA